MITIIKLINTNVNLQQVVGGDKCPIVDTYWQTETGGHLLAPLPGVWPAKPGSATLPFFGVQPAMVNEQVGTVTHTDREAYNVGSSG